MTDSAQAEKLAEVKARAVKAEPVKRKHPIVADGCEVYFNGMRFRAGDEMRSLPEEFKTQLLGDKKLVG